jgi:hydroxypyruvate isomerase
MEAVICIEMLYPELEPEEKVARIAGHGFSGIEFWGWRDKDVPALLRRCRAEGVRVANFSGHRRGSLVAAATHPVFLEDLREAVSAAQQLHCPTLMLLSNELGEGGRVLERYDQVPAKQKYRNLLDGLKEALKIVPDTISLVLEPLNTLIDHPGYFLADMSTAVSLIEEINSPRLKVLCDLYHLGVMGEDLETVIDRHAGSIGYFHVADFPGRHEPGTGTANWPALIRRIAAAGYSGPIGFEYQPERDSDESLTRIRDLWDTVQG